VDTKMTLFNAYGITSQIARSLLDKMDLQLEDMTLGKPIGIIH
jgi:hypothetical protein